MPESRIEPTLSCHSARTHTTYEVWVLVQCSDQAWWLEWWSGTHYLDVWIQVKQYLPWWVLSKWLKFDCNLEDLKIYRVEWYKMPWLLRRPFYLFQGSHASSRLQFYLDTQDTLMPFKLCIYEFNGDINIISVRIFFSSHSYKKKVTSKCYYRIHLIPEKRNCLLIIYYVFFWITLHIIFHIFCSPDVRWPWKNSCTLG